MQDTDKETPSLAQAEPAAAVAGESSADQPETLPSLAELLKAAELKAAEHHDAWLRAKAESENIRRRAQEDIAKAGKFAAEKFAAELLAVKDSLEAALANQDQNAEALKSGVELTLRQLIAAFEKSNVKEINPLDEKFDPHRHQAISQVEAEGEPNRVINVLQKGYALHERILRPALVVVSRARVSPDGTPSA
ncbi:MAG TPA: nucleotide exchange factor GrpE [Rhodocyclaceae bacterium]|nr:nucleotide exchange factor GrpE [Rhodocyclaceae bacterium]